MMGASIIRTVTSYIVGWLVGWLLSLAIVQQIGLSEEQLTWLALAVITGASTVIGSAWYMAVRAAEQRWPWVGWLLGRRGAPVYEPRHSS